MKDSRLKDINLAKRNEILELPKKDESLYYRIEIEKWYRLESKIEIAKYQVGSFIYNFLSQGIPSEMECTGLFFVGIRTYVRILFVEVEIIIVWRSEYKN